MKILVTSDSHGNRDMLEDVIRRNSKAEVVIFCGDGNEDIDGERFVFPKKMFIAVKGNCDWYCDNASELEITLCNKKIFISHGHKFGVKQSYNGIIAQGHNINADIVLFGHTHNQYLSVDRNMLVLNPGSIGYNGEYAIVEINENGNINAVIYPYNIAEEIKQEI